MLKVGDPIPEFSGSTSDGRTLSATDLRGKWAVIYFYPKAFTAGCTVETRLFRDKYADIQALGAEVVGISVDNVDTQCRFASENEVTFPLLADPTRKISRAFMVLWPLLPFDKRVTFVVDPTGVVRALFRHELAVGKHLDDVLAFLRSQ
jgi:peroxiredoxin